MTKTLVIFGLSISSSWGNGHAIPFRGLCRELAARGWQITFFERDVEWYRSNRDVTNPEYCDLRFYDDLSVTTECLSSAAAVLVGSYVPQGADVIDAALSSGRPVLFYDIDTPVTLTALRRAGATEYLRADQIPRFETYFSFTGGPALRELKGVWGAREAESLYCAVDPQLYQPVAPQEKFQCLLGYMGTYAPDHQPRLERFLID
ncbi:MAG: glycosyltransferase, partial [Chloroflexi bacterium]|nr:glycosyltransferase [Chloroflexota bacterium]